MHLISELKKLNKSEPLFPSPEARRNSRERISQSLKQIIVFLADKNIMALKEQLLFCVQKLQTDFQHNTAHFRRLANLESALRKEPARKLYQESSLEGSLLNSEENLRPQFVSSSATFVPAPTLGLLMAGSKDVINTEAICQAKEIIAGFPTELLLLLIIEYYGRLRDGCQKKHNQFASLHQKWDTGLRAIKQMRNGTRFSKSKRAIADDRETDFIECNPRISSTISRLEKALEIVFRVKVFVSTFALQMNKLILTINGYCSLLRFPYNIDIVCPFDQSSLNTSIMYKRQDSEANKKQNRTLDQAPLLNFDFEIDAFGWLKSRIPYLRLAGKPDMEASFENQQDFCFDHYTAIFQQVYDQVVNEMQVFAIYINEISLEIKGERNNVLSITSTQDADQRGSDFKRSRTNPINRRDNKGKSIYKNFGESIPPLSLRSKVLLQNQ